MPCGSYNLSTSGCLTGSKLVGIPGTTCSGCYAMKGLYKKFEATGEPPRLKRLAAVRDNLPAWQEAITELIGRKEKSSYFRWHDSGDIQSVDHLAAINDIALALPDIRFWLPTRESGFISTFILKHGSFAPNLTVRLSALKLKGAAPDKLAKRLGIPTSTVGWKGTKHTCPASQQGNKCGDCRACWQPAVGNVDYPFH